MSVKITHAQETLRVPTMMVRMCALVLPVSNLNRLAVLVSIQIIQAAIEGD